MTFGVQISIGGQGGSYELPPCPITQPVREADMKTRVYGTVEELPRAEHPIYPRFDDLTGRVFSRLTVLHFSGLDKRNRPLWACRCSCENKSLIVVLANGLKSGGTKSCSCLSRESARESHRIHGFAAGGKDRYLVQTCWDAMARCNNSQHPWYCRYGARGIKVVFSGVREFAEYLETLGPRPKGYSLDRIDNEGHYAPGNLRWASSKEQNRNQCGNRLVVYDGRLVTVAEASELTGIAHPTLSGRLSRGISSQEALYAPILPGRFVEHDGRRIPLKIAAKLVGIGYETILHRLQSGWSEHDALYTPTRPRRRPKTQSDGQTPC